MKQWTRKELIAANYQLAAVNDLLGQALENISGLAESYLIKTGEDRTLELAERAIGEWHKTKDGAVASDQA